MITRGYLRAVRRLRDVADKVRAGDTLARSTLRTGDELQELGEAFNAMVEALESAQARVESINRSLDLKVGELLERRYERLQSYGRFTDTRVASR